MVQKTFGIYSEDIGDCFLFIETGQQYIAGWCREKETEKIKAFELFSFKEPDAENFEELFRHARLNSRLLNMQFEKVYCIWGNEKSVCVPLEFYSDEMAASFMKVMFGNSEVSRFCKDASGDRITVSAIPEQALGEYNRHYAPQTHVHKYYQLMQAQQTDEATIIYLVFYHTHFIISAYKDGSLLLIQQYKYKAPEDVLYYILNICDAYHIEAQEVKIIASGLINSASPLYDVLYAYLKNFSFKTADEEQFPAEIFQDFPLHYFVSFCQYKT